MIQHTEETFSNGAFPLERSACAIFGFATFGVHLTGTLELSAGFRTLRVHSLRRGRKGYEDLGAATERDEADASSKVPTMIILYCLHRFIAHYSWPSRLDNVSKTNDEMLY